MAWYHWLLLYEGAIQIVETKERHAHFAWARGYCDRVGKPLLRVGVRRSPMEPPNGDVTLDSDPIILHIPGGVQGDERGMHFEDRQFGVCFNEHTMEHMENPEDVILAVKECVRVADVAILLAPSPYSIYATLFCPTHYLLLHFDDQRNAIVVGRNSLKTGMGFRVDRAYRNDNTVVMEQAMVVTGVAPIVELSRPRAHYLRCRD